MTCRCEFTKKQKRKGENPISSEKAFFGAATRKVFEVIEEYWYKYELDFELFAFQGNDPENKVSLFFVDLFKTSDHLKEAQLHL